MAVSTPVGSELIQAFNVTCPSVLATTSYLQCDISLADGTNLNVGIDYGDGTAIQTFSPVDFELVSYGSPVPQFYAKSPIPSSAGTVYMLANAEVKKSGYLKAIELYALLSGTVTITVSMFLCLLLMIIRKKFSILQILKIFFNISNFMY